jgi:protein-S-isoprenylcysteine O-methyltransferase Ste14
LQKYGILIEKNYIAPMKSKVKRTILLLLVAVILFAASMSAPFYNSKYKDIMQGAALGLMFAGIIIIIATLVEYLKVNKSGNKKV